MMGGFLFYSLETVLIVSFFIFSSLGSVAFLRTDGGWMMGGFLLYSLETVLTVSFFYFFS